MPETQDTTTEPIYQVGQHFESIEKGLIAVSENTESDFLDLGGRLQSGYFLASELTQRALDAGKIAGVDSEENELSQVERIVHNALEKLKKRREQVNSKSDPVKNVVNHLEKLNATRGEIEIIAKYLRAVALNIFVETARSEISNKSFSIIAQEIKDLSEKIISIARQIRYNSEDAKNRFMSIYADITKGISQMETLIDDAEQSVLDSIQNTEELVAFSYGAVKKAGVVSQGISEQVEKIVVGLQFHDNMRQRIEHIVTALKEVETNFSEADNSSEEPVLNKEKLSSAYAITVLQSDQVELIIKEIDDLYRDSNQAFESIIDEIYQLKTTLMPSDSIASDTSQDHFKVLAQALSNFQTLENQGERLLDQLHGTYRQATQTASALSEQADEVHEISRESHIKALNALIAAKNLGSSEGKTLSTLAAEMKTLSNSAEEYVKRVEKIIGAIVTEIQDLSIEDQATGEADPSDIGGTSLDEVVNKVSLVCGQMANESEVICNQAEELGVLLGDAKKSLDFFTAIGGALSLQHKELEKVKELLSPWANGSHVFSEAFSADRYTMEKERMIHAKSLASISGTPEEVEVLPGDQDIEASTEDIELFVDDQQESSSEIGDVELFGDNLPEKEDNGLAEDNDKDGDEDDLGDNIELF